ncbi:MAG: response regulator [Candidatus Omnitrophica bacterium]|nr:response regulator [Candidatus Omnitrophota bacterium]
MKLLIVDDEVEVVEGMAFYFTLRGHEVLTAQGGDEALALVKARRPQLMLLDLKMKGLSGFDIMEEVRGACPEMTTVVITGVSQENLEQECRRLGAARVIQKPVKVDELERIIEWAAARSTPPEGGGSARPT